MHSSKRAQLYSHAEFRRLLPLTYAGLVVVVVGPPILIRHLRPLGLPRLALPHRLLLVGPLLVHVLPICVSPALVSTSLAPIPAVTTTLVSLRAALPILCLLPTVTTVTTAVAATVVVVRRVASLRAIRGLLVARVRIPRSTRGVAAATWTTVRHAVGPTWPLIDEHHQVFFRSVHVVFGTEDGDKAGLLLLVDFDNHAAIALDTLDGLALLADDFSYHVAWAFYLARDALNVALENVLHVRLFLVDKVAHHLGGRVHGIQLAGDANFPGLHALVNLHFGVGEALQGLDGFALPTNDAADLIGRTL